MTSLGVEFRLQVEPARFGSKLAGERVGEKLELAAANHSRRSLVHFCET
jgi:hypothetical protein